MDPSNPLRSITQTVEADVQFALARTNEPMTGYAIEKAIGRAHARVLKVLSRLATEGVVEAEQVGQATRYSLNRRHLLASSLLQAAGAMQALEIEIARRAEAICPAPVAVMLFGSFARRDGTSASDVDLLVIRPDLVEPDDPQWTRSLHDLARAIEEVSGNVCQLLQATTDQLVESAAAADPLIDSLRSDAVCLFGNPPESIATARLNHLGR